MLGTGLFSQTAAIESKRNQLQKLIITITAKIVLTDYQKQQISYHKQLFTHKTPKIVSTLAVEQLCVVFKKIFSAFKDFFSESKLTFSMLKSTPTVIG